MGDAGDEEEEMEKQLTELLPTRTSAQKKGPSSGCNPRGVFFLSLALFFFFFFFFFFALLAAHGNSQARIKI